MDDARALLAELVAIDSVNPSLVPGGAGEAEIARFVGGWLEARGLEVDVSDAEPGRPNAVGRARGSGGGRTLLLNAHMDVVGVDGMSDPFRAARRGRPALRARRLRHEGRPGRDHGGRGGRGRARAGRRRGGGRGLRRGVRIGRRPGGGARRCTADAAIVTEPTGAEINVAVAHKGFTWHRIVVGGRAAHGSRPQDGVDAIARMGHVLVGLEQMSAELAARDGHPLLGPGSIHASIIDGGRELSTYPDSCRLQLERRHAAGRDGRERRGRAVGDAGCDHRRGPRPVGRAAHDAGARPVRGGRGLGDRDGRPRGTWAATCP